LTRMIKSKQTIWSKTFICVFAAQAFMSLSQMSVNILIARYARESLGVGDILMGNLVGMYFAVALAIRPVSGPLQTRLNKRKLLIFVYLAGCAANLGYAFTRSTGMFVFFRVLQGVQYGFMGSLTMTIAANSLPQERLAYGIAMYTLGGTVAQMIAPNIGLWLRDLGPVIREGAAGVALGYRLAFLFAATSLGCAIVPLIIMPDEARARNGADEKREAWFSEIISIHALPIAFVAVLTTIAMSGLRNYIDAFANEAGIPNIGLFATFTAITLVCSRPVIGSLMERFGTPRILPAGMLILACSLVVIAYSKTLSVILIGSVLSAIGSGIIIPGLSAMCVQTETLRRRAVASNTQYGGQDLGGYLGSLWGGIVVSRYNFSMVMLSGLIPLTLAFICFFIFMPAYSRRLRDLTMTPYGAEIAVQSPDT